MSQFTQTALTFLIAAVVTGMAAAQDSQIYSVDTNPYFYSPKYATGTVSEPPVRIRTILTGTDGELSLLQPKQEYGQTRTKRNPGKGFLYGLLGGAALGGLIGAATYTPCTDTGFFACIMHPESRGEAAVWGAIPGAVLGGLGGAIIGSFVITSTGGKAEIRPVLYEPFDSGSSAVYNGAAVRISF